MQKIKDEIRSNITEKKCNKCGVIKSVSEFNKKSAAKDSLQSNCKKCVNKIKQQWRAKKNR